MQTPRPHPRSTESEFTFLHDPQMVHKHIQVWGAARSGLWMLMPAQLCFVSKVREREGSPKPQPVSLNHLQVSQPESFLVWCDKLSRVESALYLDKTSWKCQVRVAFSSQKTPALVFPLDLYTCFPSTWGAFFHSPFHLSNSYCFFKSQFRCHFLFLTALFSTCPSGIDFSSVCSNLSH